jgi:DNA-binding SARP family transcriptional activator
MLKISMLGEFSMKYGENDISDTINRSKKMRTLLTYLITFKEREVSQDELIEALWPDESIDKPANTMKTMLHRARAALKQLGIDSGHELISYKSGAYAWTPSVPCSVDVDEFSKLLDEAEKSGISEEERADYLIAACSVYKGDFLPKNSFDMWVVPMASYFRSKYLHAACTAADLLEAQKRYDDVVSLCQSAVAIDPYEEYLHRALIRALVAAGRQQQAMAHYDYVTELFFSRFGITPTAELTALYKDIVKTSKKVETNLTVILDSLAENENDKGCYFCEYEFFRNIYQLEARSAARTGQVVYVCLLSVGDARGHQPQQNVLNRAMFKLREVVTLSLRHGDVFTRYSVCQYLVMLPTNSYETGSMVMRRICDRFRRENPKMPVVLSHALMPVVPYDLNGVDAREHDEPVSVLVGDDDEDDDLL